MMRRIYKNKLLQRIVFKNMDPLFLGEFLNRIIEEFMFSILLLLITYNII